MTASSPYRPTREFFERDPRSAQLRNICLVALDASDMILQDPDQRDVAFGALLDANRDLQDLGIAPNMHTIESGDPGGDVKRERMANDPVMAAEWLAGQVRDALERSSGFTDGNGAAFAEHDQLEGAGGNMGLVKLDEVGPKSRAFMANIAFVGAVRGFLDYEAGPSDLK